GPELAARAVVKDDPRPAADDETRVVDLAAGGAGERPNVLRPAPTGFQDCPPDGHITDRHDLRPTLLEGARLVRIAQALGLESRHDLLLDPRSRSRSVRYERFCELLRHEKCTPAAPGTIGDTSSAPSQAPIPTFAVPNWLVP